MSKNKNIEMQVFNGTDYDTLYPKTIASQIPDVYSKTEVLTTETLSKYGLTADKLPNDAFQQIKTLIDNVQASADGKARIQSGSYVGTGVDGSANKNSWTFSFPPKVVLIQRDLDSSDYNYHSLAVFLTNRIGGVVIGGATNGGGTYGVGCGGSSLTGNTFEWWDTNKGDQMNDSGVTYTIIGIG